ncbi:nuclease-related domain-containing protein [Psychrobacillus sp. FJAT-51614]|uniref:Nuclease-related domain-containing protein n=1 Tax=Psychrobacillus mangrovi TaxID=3117745 RepID=A0ABU8F950_9BACI
MIIKSYAKSIHIEAMEQLLKRLSFEHPLYPKIVKDIGAIRAGDFGEEIVFRELEKMQLPYKYYVFHKVFLFAENGFEMDILIITPYGAIILEVKNIIGELVFTENPSQLLQQKETELNKYPCPAGQLNEYKYQLSQFLLEYNISIPIYGAVVFASRNSIVKVSTDKATILNRNEVRPYLRRLQNLNPTLTIEDIEKLKDILLIKNTSNTYSPLINQFSIKAEDLKKGVECLNCGLIGMQKRKRTWYCAACGKSDHTAHMKAISTYFLLCNDFITNKECREFLLLNNRHEAKRILSNTSLTRVGNNKLTRYTK